MMSQIWVSEYTILIKDSDVLVRQDKNKAMMEEEKRNDIQDLNNYFYFYFPNKSKLVMNALKASLSLEIKEVKSSRAALDFLISHMPINSVLNSIDENISLAEAAIMSFAK